jgi:NAD(P)-dependent dehydrogenase (short-subunit alcohol dehydrogenase family)
MDAAMTGETLDGRVAVVTGGSEGIGRAVACALSDAGASVVLSSRDRARAEAVAAEVGAGRAGPVAGMACQVRDPASCRALMDGAVETFGRLDILVNNAGIGIYKPIQDMSEEEWRAQVETNLHGVFHCTKAALPHLRRTGDGGAGDAWIVNIGSLASRNSFGGGAGYNASKFGLLGMTEAMMIDLRYEGIRTSIIMPGSVDTHFGEHGGGRDWALDPADVGRAVVQLLVYPTGALVSRVEMRPTRPPRR